jgi:hypothetical protein
MQLTLEHIPSYFSFHFYVGKDIDDFFDMDKIKLFAKLIPYRISVFDIFDDFVDENDDDFLETLETKSVEEKMFKLVSMILY